jgi:acyl-CoA synthetase (AMP-forming)/AMP-acid ligase II
MPARISDFVRLHASQRPDAEATVLGKRRITYRELHALVEATARALLVHGVARGDRVATLATPHPDYFIVFLATASIGAIWVGLNPKYSRSELRQVLADAEPRLLLTRSRIDERDYRDDLAVLQAEVTSIRTLVVFDDNPPLPGALGFGEFLCAGHDCDERQLAAARDATGGRDPCLLVYTSGSTGTPKGALLHHEGLVAASLAQNEAWPVIDTRFLNYFPINHVGCVCDVSCPTLAAGGCIVFLEQFDPDRSMELMVRERVTVWASVPSVFQMQLALPRFEQYDLSHVELVVWEGAAMPEDCIRRLRQIVPRLATNFSMTESTTAITVVTPTDDTDVLANTVGLPFPGVEVRVVDESGVPLPPGRTGELQARSRYNMLGYWRRPAETAATIDDEGWLHSGDLAEQRPDGRFCIVGRLKEMYKSGGYNVYPREVEAAIEAHPAVVMAAVVSRADPVWQEVGVAYVLANTPVTAEEILAHCRGRLANYKLPKTVNVVRELPLLPIGKVDKASLRKLAATSSGRHEGDGDNRAPASNSL